MSTLTLVRHGQALPDDGGLTELGETQSAALARWWLARGESFDEVYTGTLLRQRRTEEVAAAAYREAGVHWPRAQAAVEWNEYDAPGVLSRLVPELAARDERFAAFERARVAARGTAAENRHFQRMFEIVMRLWVEGAAVAAGVEPFLAFENRVRAGLASITGRAKSRRVVVFTSGGPVGLLVARALKAPACSFLDAHWRLNNASLTGFVFGDGRVSLDSFNCVGHLERGLLSFR
jgi:broad specificity phosphatase PhoE